MDTLQNILFVAPVLLFSVIAHEYAHGYAALKQGDPTAQSLGRLTWNPAKHIDPYMTVILPLIMLVASNGRIALGGAKPVPVDPRNYRNYKRGDIIVSLAGVFTNFLIALACTGVIVVVGLLGRLVPPTQPTLGIVQAMLVIGIGINLMLIAFNLIPIPPLDGSHVVKHLLPRPLAIRYQQIGSLGLLILIALLVFGGRLLELWLRPAMIVSGYLVRWARPYILPATYQWLSL
ncbi:MAG: site-2 protease family protein [Gemmatimonadota bacterium]|nr:site-2 protease family protein [Gemmatimonadota bacterium]